MEKRILFPSLLLTCWTIVGSAGIVFLILFLCTSRCQYHLDHTFRPLFQRSRWDETQKKYASTYYERQCSAEDLSTTNPIDLIAKPTVMDAVDQMMTHGALIFPKLVDPNVANEFRDYTITKNEHLQPEDSVYVMNTHTKRQQTRWSFAFGPSDDPSIPKVLQQVASSLLLKDTLEAFLGRDPAIIKMQTITSRYRAEHQAWHPDVNPRASVLSHAHNFMMHFSLFIPLQDTSLPMGATGICPGTQYCAKINEELKDRCIQVASCTNSTSGAPIWKSGDAVLMNQNTWHRGWKHSKWGAPDRAMAVITFTSRPSSFVSTSNSQKRAFETNLPPIIRKNQSMWAHQPSKQIIETRSLSLGSPLSSFGFTLSDLQDPTNRMVFPWSFLRFFGLLKPKDAHWGWDWISSVFTRISVESNGFKRDELIVYLKRLQNGSVWEKFMVRFLVDSRVPREEENRGVWEVWLSKSLAKSKGFAWRTSWKFLSMGLFLWCWLPPFIGKPTSVHRVVSRIWMLVITVTLSSLLLGEAFVHNSGLVKGIQSGEKLRRPFPDVTTHQRYVDKKQAVITPTREDYLICTRCHSPSLLMAYHFLEYHPQNRAFDNCLESFRGYSNFPEPIKDQLATKVADRFRETRFLMQSPFTGNFTQLSTAGTKEFIRRAIASISNPLLQELEESIHFLIADILFESQERETAMAFIAARFLEDFLSKLFMKSERKTQSKAHIRTQTLSIVRHISNPTTTVPMYISKRSWCLPPIQEAKSKMVEKSQPRLRKKSRGDEIVKPKRSDKPLFTVL